MKVATRQIKGFLSAIPQNINAVLLHGNDLGMISEYGAKIAGQVAPDIDDVFSVTRLSGEQVSGDPALIGDSAQSIRDDRRAPSGLGTGQGHRAFVRLQDCLFPIARFRFHCR
jgi:hypothetical protein